MDNDKWKHRRAIFNPGFHRQYIYKKKLLYIIKKKFFSLEL